MGWCSCQKEVEFKNSLRWIFCVLDDFLQSLWMLCKSWSSRQEPTVTESSLSDTMWQDSLVSPKTWCACYHFWRSKPWFYITCLPCSSIGDHLTRCWIWFITIQCSLSKVSGVVIQVGRNSFETGCASLRDCWILVFFDFNGICWKKQKCRGTDFIHYVKNL